MLVAVLALAGCTASVPPPSPPPVVAAAPSQPSISSCPDFESVPSARTAQLSFPPRRPPGVLPGKHPPGVSLFVRGPDIGLYQDGRLTDIALPHPLHSRISHLADDGSRVSAYLWDAAGQRPFIWSRDLRTGVTSLNLAQLPFIRPEDLRSWSPDARRLLVSPVAEDSRGDGVYVLDLDGTAQRRSVVGERIHSFGWRGADEITVVSSAQPVGSAPLLQATFWSGKPGAGLLKLLGADLHAANNWSWSPDGSALALVGLDADRRSPVLQLSEVGPDRIAATPRTLMRVADLTARPEGCPYGRGNVGLSFLQWHPDGQTLAVSGRVLPQGSDFVAIVTRGAGLRSIFRSPGSCYITVPRWSATELFIPLFGPDCGATTLENRVAVLTRDGVIAREVTIPRKGGAQPSADGRWFVSLGDGEVWYLPVADPTARIVVPLDGFLTWCCVGQ